jgi:hypothetical protein
MIDPQIARVRAAMPEPRSNAGRDFVRKYDQFRLASMGARVWEEADELMWIHSLQAVDRIENELLGPRKPGLFRRLFPARNP